VADKLTDEAIKAIRDGCEQSSGVTPGPWRRYAKSPHVARDTSQPDPHPNVGSVVVAECGNYRDKELVPFNMKRWLADAAHIARCDPDTIRSAFTELLELRDRKEEWRRVQGMIMFCGEEECGDAEDAVTRLRNLIDGLIDRKREIAAKDAEIERLTKEHKQAVACFIAGEIVSRAVEQENYNLKVRVAILEVENARLREGLR
jgi:hypothetical protein